MPNRQPQQDREPVPLTPEDKVEGLSSLPVKLPKDREVAQQVARQQFVVSIMGLIVGVICIVAGVFLFVRGIQGSTSWTAKFIGTESQLADAAPGTILFVVGVVIIWITRHDVK